MSGRRHRFLMEWNKQSSDRSFANKTS